jgi:hypothetical protein
MERYSMEMIVGPNTDTAAPSVYWALREERAPRLRIVSNLISEQLCIKLK